jgi:MFS family permease
MPGSAFACVSGGSLLALNAVGSSLFDEHEQARYYAANSVVGVMGQIIGSLLAPLIFAATLKEETPGSVLYGACAIFGGASVLVMGAEYWMQARHV